MQEQQSVFEAVGLAQHGRLVLVERLGVEEGLEHPDDAQERREGDPVVRLVGDEAHGEVELRALGIGVHERNVLCVPNEEGQVLHVRIVL